MTPLEYYGGRGVRPSDANFTGCIGAMKENSLYLLANVRVTKGFRYTKCAAFESWLFSANCHELHCC